ncbi:hypothetical protein R8871_05511 [Paraburkholderia graminis C4D1M]|uniref:Uncharacterized protein n=2 Tax=Paraburkholderia graminis TaxID=60548 RepID=B1FWM4_PARG4|nr:conserved hypothetical protein [Paraburkholderia graminis C4D1M]CAB3728596.1 hypothetical protein R8871_05511 [Paraburkholderia graminis C4D1M]
MFGSAVARIKDALTDDPPSQSLSEYQAFRARLIARDAVQRRIEEAWAEASAVADPWTRRLLPKKGLAYGRHVIRALRIEALAVLEIRAVRETDETVPECVYARRALRLSANVSLQFTRATKIFLGILGMFMPLVWWRHVATGLRVIGTLEGRQLVFRNYARTMMVNRPSLQPGLDYLLRHFTSPRSEKALSAVAHLDLRTVRNARLLGLDTAEALKEFWDAWHGFSAEKLAVFAELRVIRTAEEVAWFSPWRHERRDSSTTPAVDAQARRSIARLLALGVPRERTVKLIEFWHRCAPEDLNRSLEVLATRGYDDVAQIFEALGQTLWRARAARNWDFVVDVVGAGDIHRIALFDRLLEADTLPDTDAIRALQVRGATLDELAHVQTFLLMVCDRRKEPTRVIALLLAQPHTLSIKQLAECRSYTSHRSEDELEQFLDVLARHGFGTAEGVLAFQNIYQSWVKTSNVSRLLALYRGLRDISNDPHDAAAWVADVGEKHLDSLELLVKAMEITDRAAFQGIRPFARVAKAVLAWVIDDRGLRTIEALRTWRRTAVGVEQVDDYEGNPVFQVLLDDADARGDFGHVNRNMSAFWSALWREREAIIGRPRAGNEETEMGAYWSRARETEANLSRRALPQLQHQLQATGGLLASGLIRAAWQDAPTYGRELAAFNDEVEALLKGRGPVAAELTGLQADAISAVYGIDLSGSDACWAGVAGLQQHLAGMALGPYTMCFEHRRIEMTGQIDRRGIDALLEAFGYGRRFREVIGVDAGSAWERLSPKQMREGERSVSPQTLHRHLGVLLGALPETISDALENEVEMLGLETHEPARHQLAANRIKDFFEVELGDLLPQAATTLAAKLDEVTTDALIRRLVGTPVEAPELVERVNEALTQTARRVRQVYGRWIHQQLDAFTGAASGAGAREYRAIVSKHGAAYFAKAATKICSADNERMWREPRQAHLLVFDEPGRRLVAMAILYFEYIAAIDAKTPTLVMRAINTVADADNGHDAESIVSAFLSVGKQIAEDNNLAAFAVPDNTDQHLLSNRNDIVAGIEACYVGVHTRYSESFHPESKASMPPYAVNLRSGELFYGYEHGRAPVHTLHVLWVPACESPTPMTDDATNVARALLAESN